MNEQNIPNENKEWSEFSLSQAMKGMEDEPDLYTMKDIKLESYVEDQGLLELMLKNDPKERLEYEDASEYYSKLKKISQQEIN